MNGQKYENLLQFYFSWLPALRIWYYFRLCFSFISFVFDLTLIKRSHTLNCYSFLHKFLLKTKITISLLVTVIAQFPGRKTNSEKGIYFLSIMSFSINKLKSYLFFTCKNLRFIVLCRKNFLLKEMVVVVVVVSVCMSGVGWKGWWSSLGRLAPFSTTLHRTQKPPSPFDQIWRQRNKNLNFQTFWRIGKNLEM